MIYNIQKNLFEDKDRFDPEDFKNKCINEIFTSCVSKGIVSAFSKLISADLETRYRVKSDSLHDMSFNSIKNQINNSSLFNKVVFHSDTIGNKRLWFSYNGYIFVLKKAESEGNKSTVGQIIDAQKADNHIITICYSIDELWSSITSISFQYIKNKNSIMTLYIPVVTSEDIFTASSYGVTEDNIAPATARLKVSQKKAE